MNRLAKCAAAGLVIVPAMLFAQGAQTIYKSVDESGRVTYANAPIKGGTKVDLEPLTIIPSGKNAAVAAVPVAVPAPAPRAIPVAKVTSVPSPNFLLASAPAISTAAAPLAVPAVAAVDPAPALAAPTMMAALDTGEKAQLRRTEVRQRILQSEIQVEEKSLGEARWALAEEQRRSSEIRAMRASFSATAVSATPAKPLISPVVREEIERHFERVRNLQDQVAMHEGNIAELREEMVARK